MNCGMPVYRRDLEAEDEYRERETLREVYRLGVRSGVDVPFVYGTLAINSQIVRVDHHLRSARQGSRPSAPPVRARDRGRGVRSGLRQWVVQEAVRTSRPRWKDESEARGISVEIEVQKGEVPDIRGTKSQLHDILTNLIFNAVDAMPEGGRIAIRTQPAGDRIRLTCRDTGIGMDEETRRRVFEPFYTTKMNIGTGLGLSRVYNTVKQWGGGGSMPHPASR